MQGHKVNRIVTKSIAQTDKVRAHEAQVNKREKEGHGKKERRSQGRKEVISRTVELVENY